jgi:hypothetical protein
MADCRRTARRGWSEFVRSSSIVGLGSGVLGVGVLCAAEGLRLLGALGCVGGDLLEQCVECGLLLGVKGRKNPLFCGSERVLYLGQSARSCRREAHRVAAAV